MVSPFPCLRIQNNFHTLNDKIFFKILQKQKDHGLNERRVSWEHSAVVWDFDIVDQKDQMMLKREESVW